MTRTFSTMKLLLSAGVIVFMAAITIAGTGAFFSDTETSEGNVFTAGALDLKVDSVAHYNGLICFDSGDGFSGGLAWHPAETVEWNAELEVYELSDSVVDGADLVAAIDVYNTDNPAANPGAGEVCVNTWEETDLGPAYKFFTFPDLKPGDNGENTISLHVYDNPSYACAIIDNMSDDDLGLTEPEVEDGDLTTGIGSGELAQELTFFAWADDGDNEWEDGEVVLFSNESGPASDVLDGVAYPLFTPDTTPLPAEDTQYIGLYWCYGDLVVDEQTNTLECDGSTVTNVSQTDQLTADIGFYIEQARNNEDFECPLPVNDDVTVSVGNDDLFTENDRVAAFLAGDWFFYNDTNDTIMSLNEFAGDDGENEIVTGPETTDSAKMVLHAADARYNIATYQFSATPLADIDTLKYRIYDASVSSQTPFLNFNIDFDNSDTWQRRLVQVPDGVAVNTWTEVDALADTWTISGGNWPVGTTEDGNTLGSVPKTWADILTEYPTAALRTTDSFFGVRVGHPGPDAEESYVDWIEFDEVRYDFTN